MCLGLENGMWWCMGCMQDACSRPEARRVRDVRAYVVVVCGAGWGWGPCDVKWGLYIDTCGTILEGTHPWLCLMLGKVWPQLLAPCVLQMLAGLCLCDQRASGPSI